MTNEHPNIFCLGCDYPLDGLRSSACPECGRPFDLNDIGTYRRGLGLPRLVYRGANMLEVHLKQHLLEREGIPTNTMFDAAGLAFAAGAQLYVEAADEERARQILKEAEAKKSDPSNEDDPPLPDWTCPNCGEAVDGAFVQCWNCETPHPSD